MRPRLGHIQFLNCLPLYYGLVKNDVLLDVELIKGSPRELTTGLLSGKLDIAPIPAIDYCRYHKSLLLLPNLSVSSDGEVKSILLVSNVPLDELNGKTVALTNTSVTSQALVKILLHYKYQVTPIYIEYPPDLPQMMREADAALLIGDDALRALYQPSPLLKYDLGSEWLDFCGRKMVYAVWAVHREFVKTKPELVKEVHQALYKSLEYSKENLDQIAEYAARWEIFPVGFLKSYFAALHFDFSLPYQEGLLFFLQKSQELGLVDEVAPLNFTGDAL
ncbi:MAG: menaquinone biosynthesis protein [Actinomycetota bacterium]|nr:menaquinone biosynthesis protein [Actinomycetota bacterium]